MYTVYLTDKNISTVNSPSAKNMHFQNMTVMLGRVIFIESINILDELKCRRFLIKINRLIQLFLLLTGG